MKKKYIQNIIKIMASISLLISIPSNTYAYTYHPDDHFSLWHSNAIEFASASEVELHNLPKNKIAGGSNFVSDIYNENTPVNRVTYSNKLIWCKTADQNYNIGEDRYIIEEPLGSDATQWIDPNKLDLNSLDLTNDGASWTGSHGWQFVGWSESEDSFDTVSEDIVENEKDYYAVFKRVLTVVLDAGEAETGNSGVTDNKIVATQWYNSGHVILESDQTNFISNNKVIMPTSTYEKGEYNSVGWTDGNNFFGFGDAITFNKLTMVVEPAFGDTYFINFDMDSSGTVAGTETPESIIIREFREAGVKKYRDNNGNIYNTPTAVLPSSDAKNIDGYGVVGWLDDSDTVHEIGSEFNPTEPVTTLRVHWDTMYFGEANPDTDATCTYYGSITKHLAKGEWYIGVLNSYNSGGYQYGGRSGLTITHVGMTVETCDNPCPTRIDNHLVFYKCNVTTDDATITIRDTLTTQCCEFVIAFPIVESINYPYVMTDLGYKTNFSASVDVVDGKYLHQSTWCSLRSGPYINHGQCTVQCTPGLSFSWVYSVTSTFDTQDAGNHFTYNAKLEQAAYGPWYSSVHCVTLSPYYQ